MNKLLKKDLLVFVILFGVLTLPFLFWDLDILFQKPYFNEEQGWFLMNVPFWDFIYKYAIFLGYFLAVFSLIMISVSYWKKSVVKWRKAAYFMLFVMILGPGVLVNGTFKEHWGRPRPRDITEFNGQDDYVKVWVKGATKGKSFPCGHASMGFYLAIPFLFLRKRYKSWAWGFLIFGTLYGLLIGYARMIAGGHFASDVLWAAGMVWLTGILGYYLLKVDTEIDMDALDAEAQKRKGKIITVLMGIVLPILTVSLLLATPYISNRKFSQTQEQLSKIDMKMLSTSFDEGVINVDFAEDFIVDYSVNAFGFPNSKISWNWFEGDTTTFSLKYMGWFTEVRNNIRIFYPVSVASNFELALKEGKVFIDVSKKASSSALDIQVQEGDVTLFIEKGTNYTLTQKVPDMVNNCTYASTDSVVDISLNISIEKGTLYIEDKVE